MTTKSRDFSQEHEVAARVVAVLAAIRAEPVLEIEAQGKDALMVTSIEVVAILVELEATTGIDPADPAVLKGCRLQSLQELIQFIESGGMRTP